MKYREHRGDLKSSMETTIEIEGTKESLFKVIHDEYGKEIDFNIDMLHVYPYVGIDERIGWDTYIVEINGHGVFGFTNDPLKQDKTK